MTMIPWKGNDGKPIKGADGKPVKCETCPCTAACPTDCSGCADAYSIALAAGRTPGYLCFSGVEFYVTWAAQTVAITRVNPCQWYAPIQIPVTIQFRECPGCVPGAESVCAGDWYEYSGDAASVIIECLSGAWNLIIDTSGTFGPWSFAATKSVSPCPDGTYSDGSVVS